MQAAAIFDSRAVAHDMQAKAQRGLLWAIGLSLLAHLAVLTIQVGGDSFGWRTPTANAAPDSGERFNARLVLSALEELPKGAEPVKALPEPQRVDTPRSATVTVAAPPTLPRAEALDSPTPKIEVPTPPVERIVPVTPPAPKLEVKQQSEPQPVVKEPELITPKQSELKTPPPVLTEQPPAPVPTPPPPTPVVEAQPPKPEVKAAPPVPTAITPPPVTQPPSQAVTAPVLPDPVKTATPEPVAAPIVPAPVAAPMPPAPSVAGPILPAKPVAPAAPATISPVAAPVPQASPAVPVTAAPAASATPVLTGPAVTSASAPVSAASPSGGAPSFGGAASGSAPASGSTGGRSGAVVSLPGPRTTDGARATPGAPAAGERSPSSGLLPGNIDGFDPYKSRSSVARDAARELNNQRGRAPTSVAPSLNERERFDRSVGDSYLPPCPALYDDAGKLKRATPEKWCRPRGENEQVLR